MAVIHLREARLVPKILSILQTRIPEFDQPLNPKAWSRTRIRAFSALANVCFSKA
jgi:hypothetical protein